VKRLTYAELFDQWLAARRATVHIEWNWLKTTRTASQQPVIDL